MEDGERKEFGTNEPMETPYQRARQVIDDRVGSAKRQAYIWRLFGLGALVVAAIAVGGVIWQSLKARVEPYVVEVGDEGQVRLVGKPQTENFRPKEAVRQKFVEDWLLFVRERSSDRKVVRENLMKAYERVRGKAKGQLDVILDEEAPFEFIEKKTREVTILSVNEVGEQSYRVEWREKTKNDKGYDIKTEQFVGIVELTYKQAKTKKGLMKNPLGLYVTHFSMNRRSGVVGKETSEKSTEESQ